MKLSAVCEQVISNHEAMLVRPTKEAQPGELDCKPLFTGNNRGWTIVDAFTASTYKQVYDALNEANRSKLDNMAPARAINVMWSVVK